MEERETSTLNMKVKKNSLPVSAEFDITQAHTYTEWFTEFQPHCVFATIENVSNIISRPMSAQLQQL